jgi:predicted DNA-binding WGR domain protein
MNDLLKQETLDVVLQSCLKNGYLRLQALNSDKNVFRDYELHISPGLFDSHVVQIAYGRIGTRGHVQNHVFDTQMTASTFIKKCLQKRLSSVKRIGCAYTVSPPL